MTLIKILNKNPTVCFIFSHFSKYGTLIIWRTRLRTTRRSARASRDGTEDLENKDCRQLKEAVEHHVKVRGLGEQDCGQPEEALELHVTGPRIWRTKIMNNWKKRLSITHVKGRGSGEQDAWGMGQLNLHTQFPWTFHPVHSGVKVIHPGSSVGRPWGHTWSQRTWCSSTFISSGSVDHGHAISFSVGVALGVACHWNN